MPGGFLKPPDLLAVLGRSDPHRQLLTLTSGPTQMVGRLSSQGGICPVKQQGGDSTVELCSLAGEQHGLDRLTEQGVAQRAQSVTGQPGQRGTDQLAEGTPNPLRIVPGHGDQLVVRHWAAGHRQHPENIVSRGRRGGCSTPQQLGQLLGQHRHLTRCQQLLDEERVAVTSSHQRGDLVGTQRIRRHRDRHGRDLVRCERTQVDLLPLTCRERCFRPNHGRTVVRVSGAGGQHDGHRSDATLRRHVGQEVAGRVVGPVQVLDDDQQRSPPPDRLPALQHSSEQALPRPLPGSRPRRHRRELGHQARDVVPNVGSRVVQAVPQQRAAVDEMQLPQAVHDRQQGQLLRQRQT